MTRPRHRERGLALVLVVIVLVAMALVATPFAISMRGLESSARQRLEQERARAGALSALAVARRFLEDTHPAYDRRSPLHDDADELSEVQLLRRYGDLLPRDPRGSLRSVRIEDEQGKVDLGTASYHLLGNLFGGRTVLTAKVSAAAGSLPLASRRGFGPSGPVLVGREQVEFSSVESRALQDVGRGHVTELIPRSVVQDHPAGTPVLDARLLALVQFGWHMEPGRWHRFRSVDDLLGLDRIADTPYTPEELSRVDGLLTVHGGPPRWSNAQRVVRIAALPDGGAELIVEDGSRFGSGTVVRLEGDRGQRGFNVVLDAWRWGRHWRLRLLEEPGRWMSATELVVRSLDRTPVNVNTAPRAVVVALLTGLAIQPVVDVITDEQAARLALLVTSTGRRPDDFAMRVNHGDELARAGISRGDLTAAARRMEELGLEPGRQPAEVLAAHLVGLRTARPGVPIAAPTAERLADAILAGKPGSHEDLRALLDGAVADGRCSSSERDLVLLNAVDAADARLLGGTAPFCYASGGVFTLRAAAVENAPSGRERARQHVREVVSVAPAGESVRIVETQGTFEVLAEHRGWLSEPSPLRVADRSRTEADELSPWQRALARAGVRADRGTALVTGRQGPSARPNDSVLTLAPQRSPLSGTVHFDEGVPGLSESTPRGLNLSASPLTLPLHGVAPALTDDLGRLLPFTVEFWLEVDDVDAEIVLLDTGAGALEDRVLLMLSGGELLLRVSDGALADFESAMPAERPPPAGEIRYAFDDGLVLRAGVPYHVLASIGGARDTQLALFVDGVPRGRRSFTTFLTEPLRRELSRTEGSTSGFGTHRLRVDDTSGFPERGVLRIGREIIEYASKTEDTFVAEAAGDGDTFGGRARRSTLGEPHETGELVELLGYSRPLASDVAGLGDGVLDGRLAPFAVAEVNSGGLSSNITVSMTFFTGAGSVPREVILGTGLLEGDETIPLRSPGGGSLEGIFQEGGGYAILFTDYGGGELVGQPYAPADLNGASAPIPPSTDTGAWLGGAEVVRYGSYNGEALLNCRRGADGIPLSTGPLPSPLAEPGSEAWVTGGTADWDVPKAFLTTPASEVSGDVGLPDELRVLVIPISVEIDDVDLATGFHPGVGPGGAFLERSYLVQVGVDFAEDDATEWIRWNTPTEACLVRDDATAIEAMLGIVSGSELWRGDADFGPQLAGDLNEALEFRGQVGTLDGNHETGASVLPVLALGHWGADAMDPVLGRPGRHDPVTLFGDDDAREAHVVNHATTEDADWLGYSLVALRDPITGDFATTADTGWSYDGRGTAKEQEAALRVQERLELEDRSALNDRLARVNVDSRRLTRLVKAPSGELPSAVLDDLVLGAAFDGRATPGATIDELRFTTPDAPGPLVPTFARFALAGELAYDEDEMLELGVQDLHLPHARVTGDFLGRDGLEVLTALPEGGGLLRIGEEIVGYAGLDPVASGAVFLTGRGLYGTRRAPHAPGEPVTPLLFWPVSPLTATVGADGAWLPVAEPEAFPADGGLVWIDDELVGYAAVRDGGLWMPAAASGRGHLRGRFGTSPDRHLPGAMIRWQPRRVSDRALTDTGLPESEWGRLRFVAPEARFTELALRVERPDPGVQLQARVALDGRAEPHNDPALSEHVLVVPEDEVTPGTRSLRVDRRASVADLLLGVRFLPDAFDMRGFASNAWKTAPRVRVVALGHEQPSVVLEHVEWR